MEIRRAKEKDMDRINELLRQVCMVHHKGRPDLFQGNNNRKYTDEQLMEIIKDDKRPVFVAVDENDEVMGYAFCMFQQHSNDNILTDIKTLYIDDLCVDEKIMRFIASSSWLTPVAASRSSAMLPASIP